MLQEISPQHLLVRSHTARFDQLFDPVLLNHFDTIYVTFVSIENNITVPRN